MYAGFARLAPGYELGWHYDPDPSPTIERVRVQLPFNTSDSVLHVNDDRMEYTEGKLMCFKSSALHRVENRSDMHRYSLIFDVFMPVRA
jgi:aspartyl/asparaginyl beta-hydroxylase (cupin superfamily)